MNRIGPTQLISIGLVAALAACTGLDEEPSSPPPEGSTVGGGDNTFNHANDFDPNELLSKIENEGQPLFSARLHSCAKIPYTTLGTVLTGLGVNVNNGNNLSAGGLYRSGMNAIGSPNYAARIRENFTIATSATGRLFDIFVAAAPEVITALQNGTIARCTGAPPLFDANNRCDRRAISCLTGVAATQTHVDICNITVTAGDTIDNGKRLAVATMLAAAHTCD